MTLLFSLCVFSFFLFFKSALAYKFTLIQKNHLSIQPDICPLTSAYRGFWSQGSSWSRGTQSSFSSFLQLFQEDTKAFPCQEGIVTRCPNRLNWLFSMWRSSSSTLSTPTHFSWFNSGSCSFSSCPQLVTVSERRNKNRLPPHRGRGVFVAEIIPGAMWSKQVALVGQTGPGGGTFIQFLNFVNIKIKQIKIIIIMDMAQNYLINIPVATVFLCLFSFCLFVCFLFSIKQKKKSKVAQFWGERHFHVTDDLILLREWCQWLHLQ